MIDRLVRKDLLRVEEIRGGELVVVTAAIVAYLNKQMKRMASPHAYLHVRPYN